MGLSKGWIEGEEGSLVTGYVGSSRGKVLYKDKEKTEKCVRM